MSDATPNPAFEKKQAAKPGTVLVRAFLGIAVVTILVMVAMARNPSYILVTPTSSPPGPYSPEAFGLPGVMGGHEVLAVLNSQNLKCQAPDSITIILRVSEKSVGSFLANADGAIDPSVIESELRKAGVPGKLEELNMPVLGRRPSK